MSQVHFNVQNVFEPYRKYYGNNEIILRFKIEKTDPLFDNTYRESEEPKSH